MATDAASLLSSANCYACYTQAQWELMELALLAQIATGSSPTCGNYSGGTPTIVPSGTCAITIDTSNGHVWYWYNNVWH